MRLHCIDKTSASPSAVCVGMAARYEGTGVRARRWFTLLAGIVVVTVGAAASAVGADHGETAITCTNPVSGTSWQIRVDYDRGTVDSYPARIGDAKISWHDATDGGNYTLDRKTGNLTVVVASSTGGYFLYDRCKLEN
jgi:hypothetical protein